MVIEDEPLAIEIMEDYIGRRTDLFLAAVGSELSEIEYNIDKYKPSIIFLDFVIPAGDYSDFNFGKIPSDISVVVISATPLNHFQGKLPDCDIYELPKPFSYDSFDRCINKVLIKRLHECNFNKI